MHALFLCPFFFNTAPGYICSTSILEKSPQKRNIGRKDLLCRVFELESLFHHYNRSGALFRCFYFGKEAFSCSVFRPLMQLENSCCFLAPFVVFRAVILVVVVVYFALRNHLYST
jgi:hypothetical protein